jgi:hypothetical protein
VRLGKQKINKAWAIDSSLMDIDGLQFDMEPINDKLFGPICAVKLNGRESADEQ